MIINKRKDILNRQNEINTWINNHESKSIICKRLICKPETLERYLKIMGITYNGNRGLKGKKSSTRYIKSIDYINCNSVKSHTLKNKLIKDGIKQHICEKCKNSKWLNGNIPLELHHIDGNHYNNSINNLILLCPNCHALEDNNSGRANKKLR